MNIDLRKDPKLRIVAGALIVVLVVMVVALVRCVSDRRAHAPQPGPAEPAPEVAVDMPAPVSPEDSIEGVPPARVPGTPGPLAEEDWRYLLENGWSEYVGDAEGVWVSVEEQMFRLVRSGEVLWEVPCATAAKGTGNVAGSYQTPLGWHAIKRKTGADAPWGQVFRGGRPTGEIWKPGQSTKEDLVLTRVLFLDGLEPGKNKGGNVDSYARYIYVHGTNDEERIGTPSSHGCIRLRNDDVIVAYDRIAEGTRLLITERADPAPTPPSI